MPAAVQQIVWEDFRGEGGRISGEFEEVARLRVRASAGKQSMLCREMGRKSRSAQGGERGGRGRKGGGGQCSGGRHTSTARMEVQGRICSLDRSKEYGLYLLQKHFSTGYQHTQRGCKSIGDPTYCSLDEWSKH